VPGGNDPGSRSHPAHTAARRRRLLPTVAETIGIAAAAACAGLLVGKLIS
jgi:hypothetical protein